ncbi:MAG: hypothetical protein CMA21_04435 [Euryarchaeota archaeon]|nr:hypothetical protein [Euryarchaeota archaeon]
MMQNNGMVSLAFATLFLLVAWNGVWFEISALGTYTEGLDRNPSISSEYVVDSDQESFEMHIQNATPLLLYWAEREDVTFDSKDGHDEDFESDDTEESQGIGCDGSCLDISRSIVQMTMLGLLAAIFLASKRTTLKIKFGLMTGWAIGTIVILVAVPMAIAMDFGIAGGDEADDSSSTGGFDSATHQSSVGDDQFAHYQETSGMSFGFNGITFNFESVGYDLGILEENERQAVIDHPPSEGEPGYESLIGFHGQVNVNPGEILNWWVMTLLPIILVLKSKDSRATEEE